MDSMPPVLNMADEAVAIRRLLPGCQSLVQMVTNAFHIRRSQRLFERQGLQVLSFSVNFQASGRWAGPFGVIPASGCPRLWPRIKAPARCGNFWDVWSSGSGDED